jgi:peptide/nickel transport system substrate-binding protein
VGQPDQRLLSEELPVPKRDVAKAKALIKEAGVQTPIVDRLHGAARRREQGGLGGRAGDGGGGRLRLKIRVTEFATSLKQAEQGEYQMYSSVERAHRSGRQHLLFAKTKQPQNSPASPARRRQGAR